VSRDAVLRDLAVRIAAITLPHPTRVAIDGVDAAGKTTLSDELAPRIEALGRPVIRASIDGFHNPASVRRRRGPLSPEGYYHDSFDYAALVTELLGPLGPGGTRVNRRAVFDFRSDRPVDAPTERAEPNAILLLDGVFLLRPELLGHFDFSVFVHADFHVTLARAEVRDASLFGSAAEVRQRYGARYVPGQQMYLAEVHPERVASVVIDNNEPGRPAILTRADRTRTPIR
jgi:uridine kinase